MSAHCATEPRPRDAIRRQRIFGIGDASPKCRRHRGRAFALKPSEEASSITFQIGRRGSRYPRPLPARPPTIQAFRSVLSEAPSVSTQRRSRLPFLPPSPRSSIPESSCIISKSRHSHQVAILRGQTSHIAGTDPAFPTGQKAENRPFGKKSKKRGSVPSATKAPSLLAEMRFSAVLNLKES